MAAFGVQRDVNTVPPVAAAPVRPPCRPRSRSAVTASLVSVSIRPLAARRRHAQLVADRVRILDVVVVRVLEPVVAKGARREQARKRNRAAVVRQESVSSVTSVGTAACDGSIDGPSSSNLKASPMSSVAVSVSRSPSVIVAVSVTSGRRRTAAEARLVRIGRIVVHHRTDLVERHMAGIGVQRDGEHRAAGRRRARHHRPGRVPATDTHRLGQRIDQTAGHAPRPTNAQLVADRVQHPRRCCRPRP